MRQDGVVGGTDPGEQNLHEQAEQLVHDISAQGKEAFHRLMSDAHHEGLSDEEILKYEGDLIAVQTELRTALVQYQEELQQLTVERSSKHLLAEKLKSPSTEKMLQSAETKLGAMRQRVEDAQKTERAVGEAAKKGGETRGKRVNERTQKERENKERAVRVERFIPALEAAGIGISDVVNAAQVLNPDFINNFVDTKLENVDEYKASLSAEKQVELEQLLKNAEEAKERVRQHFNPSSELKKQTAEAADARNALETAKDTRSVNAEEYRELDGEVKMLEQAAAKAESEALEAFIVSKHTELDGQQGAALKEFIIRTNGNEAIQNVLVSGEIDIDELNKQIIQGIVPEKFTLKMYQNLPPETIKAIVDNIPDASFVRGDLLRNGLPLRTFDTLRNPLVTTDAFLRRQRAVIDTYRQSARDFGDENQRLSQGFRPDSFGFENNKKYFCDRTRRQLERFKDLCSKQGVSNDAVEEMIALQFERAGIERSDFDDDDKIMEKQQKINRVMYGLSELGWRHHGEPPKGHLIRLSAVVENFRSIEVQMTGAVQERAKLADAMKAIKVEVSALERQLAMLPQAWEEGKQLEDEQTKIINDFGARNTEIVRRMQQTGSAQEFNAVAKELVQLQADLVLRLKSLNGLEASYNAKINDLQNLKSVMANAYDNAYRATNGDESGVVEKDRLEQVKSIRTKHDALRKETPQIASNDYGRSEMQHYNGKPLRDLSERIGATLAQAKRYESDMIAQQSHLEQQEAQRKQREVTELRRQTVDVHNQTGRDIANFNNIIYGISDDLKLIGNLTKKYDDAQKKFGLLTRKVKVEGFRRNGTGLSYDGDHEMTKDEVSTQKNALMEHEKALKQRGALARTSLEESLLRARQTAGNVIAGIETLYGQGAASKEITEWKSDDGHYQASLKWYDENVKPLLESED